MMRPTALAAAVSALTPASNNIFGSRSSRKHRPPHVWKAEVGANSPSSEDRSAIRFGVNSEGDMFGIWDGHGGHTAAQHASEVLLKNLATSVHRGSESEQALREAHRQTEASLRSLCWDLCSGGNWRGAMVGACSLVVHVAHDRRSMSVANAGDCRAVMAIEEGGVLRAEALSRDHNAREPEEQVRIIAEHPGESDILVRAGPTNWYVKQRLQPTRALGDFFLKEAKFNARELGYAQILTKYTPPYVLWEPEINRRTIQSGDIFVIMATDGLWDELSNQEAIEVAASAIAKGADPAEELVQKAMQIAAAQVGLTVADLDRFFPLAKSEWSPGLSKRRQVHDDITVLVIKLNDEWQQVASSWTSGLRCKL